MLRVVYQAANLKPGKMSDWRESRGLVEIRVAKGTRAKQFLPSLNETLRDFVKNAQWYQLWDGEIVSADHPENPICVVFEVSPFQPAPYIDIREHKGRVVLYVSPTATIDRIAPLLNTSIEEFLAGGQWFQLWHGEIVTMDSPPDSMAA
jgi:hypothetical protein